MSLAITLYTLYVKAHNLDLDFCVASQVLAPPTGTTLFLWKDKHVKGPTKSLKQKAKSEGHTLLQVIYYMRRVDFIQNI